MNQLSGRFANVVLAIEEGKGMEFLRNVVNISANFNSRILESDKVKPSNGCPCFNTELVWEIEKKELRKIRSSNQPLRVECITSDDHNRKERVGFTLLSLRSAQILTLKDAKKEIPFKWNKLIGCQTDKKNSHPELYLSLTIRDHLLAETEEVIPQKMPYISEEETDSCNENCDSQFPVKYMEDGYIQIGPAVESTQIFSFKLFIKNAVNLDTLLPEVLVFNENKEQYHMTFKIFGISIKTKPFYKELHDKIVLNEKIVVRLLSTIETLKDFFSSQYITITFFCGNDRLGITTVDLKNVLTEPLLDCDLEDENMSCHADKYFFKFPSPNGIVPFDQADSSPYIEVETGVTKSLCEKPAVDEVLEEPKPKTKTIVSNLTTKSMDGSGDQEKMSTFKLGKLQKVDVKAQSDQEISEMDPIKVDTTKSFESVVKNIPLTPTSARKKQMSMDTYQKFVLEVSLINLVWKKRPKDKKIIFKFLHPKAASYITFFTEVEDLIGKEISLNNLTVKITYISTDEEIANLLNAWPPKFVLTDEKERLLTEEHEFNTTTFLSQQQDHHKYVAELKSVRVLDPLGKLFVGVTLKGYNLESLEEKSKLCLRPAVVDEIITVKEITDIDKWKSEEKLRFQEQLKKIKENEMEKLHSDWEKKKNMMEQTLNKSMKKCKSLQDTLQTKVDALKTDKVLKKKRSNVNKFEEIFKENWSKFKSSNNSEIIELLSKVERDNECLNDIIKDLRKKLRTFEKSTLTKEQTTTLLQELRGLEEKFRDAQKAKSYFKDQWKKACEEIHDLKTEDYKQLQNHLKHSKEELSQLSLDHYTEGRSTFRDLYSIDGGLSTRSFL